MFHELVTGSFATWGVVPRVGESIVQIGPIFPRFAFGWDYSTNWRHVLRKLIPSYPQEAAQPRDKKRTTKNNEMTRSLFIGASKWSIFTPILASIHKMRPD